MARKLPRNIEAALEATGLPWSVEKGGQHRKIRLSGRLAATIPMCNGGCRRDSRAEKNVIAEIRRKSREIKSCG